MAEQIKHTPGPWERNKFTVKAGAFRIRQDSGPEGACVNSQQRNMMVKEANARLIAAAPELLAACQELVNRLADWEHIEDEAVKAALKQGRAVIARATGN